MTIMHDTKIIMTKKEEDQEEDELELSSSDDTPSPDALPSFPPLVPSPSATASPSPPPVSLSPQILPGPSSPFAPASSLPSPNIKRNRPHRRLFAPNLGPGQHIFQLDLKPGSPSSNGSSSGGGGGVDGGVGSSESDDRRAPATYTSITSFNPPSPLSACKCSNKSKKPMRHWRTACPYNPNPLTVDCDVCGRTFTRKQNMERHKKDFHTGSPKERRKQSQIPTVTSSHPTVVVSGGGSAAGKDGPARLHSPATPTEKG